MGYAGVDEADIRPGVALLREAMQSFVRGGQEPRRRAVGKVAPSNTRKSKANSRRSRG
jgi:hypothetical protein